MRIPALFFLVASSACVAQTEAHTQKSPITDCDGHYVCESPVDGRFKETLVRQNGRCMFGFRPLDPDGTAATEGDDGYWKGTADAFDVCVGSCAHCVRTQPAPTSSASSRCSGSPSSCSSNSPGSCSSIRGCRMATHVRYDGSYDNECEGSPDSCDTISSEDACVRQGCSWN